MLGLRGEHSARYIKAVRHITKLAGPALNEKDATKAAYQWLKARYVSLAEDVDVFSKLRKCSLQLKSTVIMNLLTAHATPKG